METMNIHFKNGTSEIIPYEIAKILQARLLEDCTTWQSFTNREGKITLIVNLDQITHISPCK